ncbi:MAG: hypothetical protein ACI82A_000147 [Candidatus Azotimanducaceae bacterium]
MKAKPALLSVVLMMAASLLQADPLFDSDETLVLSLEGPFGLMGKDRDKEKSWPGVLSGEMGRFDVDLSLRGNRRLNKSVCEYPPLRLDFQKKQIRNTVFAHQGDIKLVVQCDYIKDYANYLRFEFLIYKALNLLTTVSYQVRWVEIVYSDPGAKPGSQERRMPAFFVERKSRLAKRLGSEITDVTSIYAATLAPEQASLLSLFQYVIGNPDYSLAAAAPGESCCHNAKLLVAESGQYMPVIYDFDSAGLINARYAKPADGLGIEKVTQRVYRGYCLHNGNLEVARAALVAKEEAIKALFQNDEIVEERAKKRVLKFLEASFKNIKTPKNFKRFVTGRCRG